MPGFASDFPYIATRVKIDKYAEQFVPWHWHRPIELFYMESGTLEYYTPKKKIIFPAGSGGLINSNILHMTKAVSQTERNVQLLHIFDPILISGTEGSRIEKSYVMPIIAAPQIEILPLYPDNPEEKKILKQIANTFNISENDKNDERLKMMLIYIHEHFAEKITISELAAAGYLSERVCFRLFQNYLHTTPTEYIKSYRLQEACRMLIHGQDSVTDIGYICGFGNGSYFGKVFLSNFGITPTAYRCKWQDNTK